jgi:hypothetical protein
MARKNAPSGSARTSNSSAPTPSRGTSKPEVASPAKNASRPANTPRPANTRSAAPSNRSSGPAQTHQRPNSVSHSTQGDGHLKSPSRNGPPSRSQVKSTHDQNGSPPSTHGRSKSLVPPPQRNGQAVSPPTGQSIRPLGSPTTPNGFMRTPRDSKSASPSPRRLTPASRSEGTSTPAHGSPSARIRPHSSVTTPSAQKKAVPQAKHDRKPINAKSHQSSKRAASQTPFTSTHTSSVQIRRKPHPTASLFQGSTAVATGYDIHSPKSTITRNMAPLRMHPASKHSNHHNRSIAASSAGNGAWHPGTGTAIITTRRSAHVHASNGGLARNARLQAQPTTSTTKVTVNLGTTVNEG